MDQKFRRRIRRKLKEVSTRGAWYAIRKSFRSHVYHCKDHVLLARALDLPHRPTPKASGATIRPLTTRNDFDRLRTAFPDRAADLARLRDQGLDSFGAFIDHELVGYMWVAKHDHFDVKLNEIVPLGPNEILQLAGFVAERSRGTSLALEGSAWVHQNRSGVGLQRRGYRTSFEPQASF